MEIPAAQTPKARSFRSFRAISALILREMSSTYGRSPGGYIWAVLEPLAGIALLSALFSLVVRSPALGTNFPYYFATGLLPFMFYISISGQIAGSIRFSRPFLAYPAVTFLDAMVARFLLNALTQLLVLTLVIGGIVLLYDLHPIIEWTQIFLAISMLVVFTLSVGVMNCYLFFAFPLWERLWPVLNRPIFILSGALFIPEVVPGKYRDWFMLNPLPHITSQFRKGFFITYDAVHVSPSYVFVLSSALGSLGLLFLLKNHKDLALK